VGVNNFKEFYGKYKDRLLTHMKRITGDYHLSNDIVQESFTRYLEHYGGVENSPSLLFAIARNVFFDSLRDAYRNSRFEEPPQPLLIDPEDQLLRQDEYRQILSAWEKLEPSEQNILGLVSNSLLSYREIADMTGFSETNVKVKVYRARVKLKQKKKEEGENAEQA
jgi:RNA polymerase sigma-70 factor (ECF subfamily)